MGVTPVPVELSRRTFLTGIGALVVAPTVLQTWPRVAFAATPAVAGSGPYGPLQPADANGLQLPAGFTSRLIATSGQPVSGTGHVWHFAPDGGECYPAPDGGWIYVSNAELGNANGGVGAIRFGATGDIIDAYSILSGTNRNCSGGATPWGTWLSCEEAGANGEVFECDPQQPSQGVVRPLLGSFNHEAACVDPQSGAVYLTEDAPTGRLYKFVPTTPGDLSAGQLFAAIVTTEGAATTVSWQPTSSHEPDRDAATAAFNGGEGIYLAGRTMYFATKGDRRIWELDLDSAELAVAYDCLAFPDGDLDAVDAVTVHQPTQRVFVAEDGGNMEVGVMAARGTQREVAAFCRFAGHGGSEVTGTAFSPDGTRLYLSSQRGTDGSTGITVEITGPFDRAFPPEPPVEPVRIPITNLAHVRGGSYADTNFASSWLHQVCFNGSDQYTRLTYLSVDTAAVAGAVSTATLLVNARMSSGDASPMHVHAVSPSWDRELLTWNNRPAPSQLPIASFTVSGTSSQWYAVDVTAHVAAQRDAGETTAGFVIAQAERNGRLAYLYSPRTQLGPALELTVGGVVPPPEPVVIAASAGTYVRGGVSRESTNYSSAYFHQVCNNTMADYTRVTYLVVPLDELDGVRASSATLRLWAKMSSGDPSEFEVRLVEESIDPSTLTWLTAAPTVEPATRFVVDTDDTSPIDVDVTEQLLAARQAGRAELVVGIVQVERNGRLGYVHTTARPLQAPRLIVAQA